MRFYIAFVIHKFNCKKGSGANMKDIIYNLKLIYSPVKVMLCIMISAITPFIVKSTSMYDFYNSILIFIPIIGVIIFSEIPLIDNRNGMDEIMYLAQRKVWSVFFYRIISAVVGVSLLVLFSGYLFVLKISYQNILIAYDLQTQIQLLLNVIPYILIVGVSSMTISNVFRSVKFAYVIGGAYCLLNVTYVNNFLMKMSFENENSVYMLLISIVLLFVNLQLDSIKPIKRGVLVKMLRIEKIKMSILALCREYNLLTEEEY